MLNVNKKNLWIRDCKNCGERFTHQDTETVIVHLPFEEENELKRRVKHLLMTVGKKGAKVLDVTAVCPNCSTANKFGASKRMATQIIREGGQLGH